MQRNTAGTVSKTISLIHWIWPASAQHRHMSLQKSERRKLEPRRWHRRIAVTNTDVTEFCDCLRSDARLSNKCSHVVAKRKNHVQPELDIFGHMLRGQPCNHDLGREGFACSEKTERQGGHLAFLCLCKGLKNLRTFHQMEKSQAAVMGSCILCMELTTFVGSNFQVQQRQNKTTLQSVKVDALLYWKRCLAPSVVAIRACDAWMLGGVQSIRSPCASEQLQ